MALQSPAHDPTGDNPRVATFRFDASARIGGGHAMRSTRLADALADRGWGCVLAITPETAEWMPPHLGRRHRIIVVSGGPEDELTGLSRQLPDGSDVLIIDHYQRHSGYESRGRDLADRIVVFDDLANRAHDCDILVDPTPGRSAGEYAGLVPPSCSVLAGPDYALLDRRFFEGRQAAADGLEVRRLLVSFGFADQGPTFVEVLHALQRAGLDVDVDLALARRTALAETISAEAGRLSRPATIYFDSDDLAGLMKRSQIVIGASGTMALERCCLGLPSITVVLAENQRPMSVALAEAGATIVVEAAEDLVERVVAALKILVADSDRRQAMARAAGRICDGLGVPRLALAIEGWEKARDGQVVSLRRATLDDAALMLDWQREPEARRFSRNTAAPEPEGHRLWCERKLADRHCIFHIVLHAGVPAGILRLDACGTDPLAFEISVLVPAGKQQLGIGRAALLLIRRLLPQAELRAEVLPENQSSHRLFESAGFTRTDGGYVAFGERNAGHA